MMARPWRRRRGRVITLMRRYYSTRHPLFSLSLSLSLASLYLQVPRARLILLTSSLVINYSVPGHTTNTSAGTNGPATPVNGFSYVAKKRKEKVVIVEGRGWSSLH